jgi:RsiW-degrading membrane proteinase PrsW (M82 family)
LGFEGFVLIAIAPGLFWLWLFVRLDRVRPAPRRLIALTFLWGTVSVIPAAIIETFAIGEEALEVGTSLSAVALAMFAVVGPVEELSKFAAVRFSVFRSLYFDEPMDGLVYSAAASLGFASLENLIYVLNFGPEVMLGRAPLSTLAHLVFGNLWGYGLALHQRSGRMSPAPLLLTLLAAASLHASFNVAIFSGWPLISVVLVAVGAVWAYSRFLWGQRTSPFRYRRSLALAACWQCGTLNRTTNRFCKHCGAKTRHGAEELVCGNCKLPNWHDALYCTRCGDRLLR